MASAVEGTAGRDPVLKEAGNKKCEFVPENKGVCVSVQIQSILYNFNIKERFWDHH